MIAPHHTIGRLCRSLIGKVLVLIALLVPSLPAHADYVRQSRQIKKTDFTIQGLTLGGTVRAIAVAPNGDVYAGGSFVNGAGNSDIDFIARWDGTQWRSLGKGLTAPTNLTGAGVYAIAINGSKVYVGGGFSATGDGVELNNFARWDMNTQTWEPLMYPCSNTSGVCGPGMTTGYVFALAAPLSGPGVFVGGYFNTPYLAPSNVRNLGFYDGTAWSTSGPGMPNSSSRVYALFVDQYSGSLYVGGDWLYPISYATGGQILRWTGTAWESIEGAWDIEGYVRSIVGSNGNIYVAGDMRKRVDTSGTGAAIYAHGVVKYDGANWTRLGSNPVGEPAYLTDARAVRVVGSNIYLGGFFNDTRPGTVSHKFARWTGTSWNNAGAFMGTDYDKGVLAMSNIGSHVYVGGNFANAGGNPDADYIARFDGVTWHALANPTPPPAAPTATPVPPPSAPGGASPSIPKPIVKAIGSSGRQSSIIKLSFKIYYRGPGTSERVTISKNGKVFGRINGNYSAVTNGGTYSFKLRPGALPKGTYSFCVVSIDNYSRPSNKSCAPLKVM